VFNQIGREYPLRVGTKGKSGLLSLSSALQHDFTGSPGDFMLFLRLLPPPAARKTVFIIRHAESNWNRAEKRLDVASMMASVDHGLSQKGRTQAEQLWRRIELEACMADLMSASLSSSSQTQTSAADESGGGGGGGSQAADENRSTEGGEGDDERGGQLGFSRATPVREADLAADATMQALVLTRSQADNLVGILWMF
jgi:hypothetical protein